MTTQTWLANTTGKTEASAGTAVTLRAAQSGSSKKLTVNSGLISFLQNSSALTMSGYSLTGSQATSLLDMTGVWNTSGTPTALKLNVTDTNSNASSALLDLQVGGVSQFKVSKAGAVTAVGVAIPTISSSDTLSNKTLSSPVLSGTVAGSATWSAEQRISGPYIGGSTSSYRGLSDTSGVYASAGAILVWGGSGDEHTYLSARTGSNVFIRANGLAGTSLIIANSALTWGGIAVPTISSTDTLSNKTLSSPTLSGTVAGSVSFSGTSNFGGVHIINGTGTNSFKITDSSVGTVLAFTPVEPAGVRRVQFLFSPDGSAPTSLGFFDQTGIELASGKGFKVNSVAVPTISSTDTLTNKTLSSPTLSGTVAGSPSWSGVQTFPDNSKIGDLLGGNGEARLNDDSAFFSWYNSANTVRSGYLQMTSAGAVVLASEISGANINITTAGAGVLQLNSVAVPTISSTDTLSNKTLSGVTMADGTNIVLNTTTGTKIGTSTSQKLGFFNATPVVQPTAVADATDAASVITQLNALLSRMRDLGLIAT